MRKLRKIACMWIMTALLIGACGQTEGENGAENLQDPEPSSSVQSSVPEPMAEVDQGPDKTTILIYMVGSDLESASGAATEDLAEMEASGVNTDKVQVVIYTGGSTQWHSHDISPDENGVYVLKTGGLEKVEAFEEQSMGEAGTLSDFLNYAYEKFPADSFDLILWDHGQGPVMGYGIDKLHKNDSLTLPEIKEALEQSPFGPENPLNFIGFDACLMSSAELVCITADHAEYLIASQETEPGFGWNYEFLSQVPKVKKEKLPEVIVDAYAAYCKQFGEDHEMFNSEVTLSVMKLSEADRLGEAVNGLFAAASKDVSGSFRKLALSRIASRDLGRASTGSDYDLVDLIDLAEQMEDVYPRETAQLKAVLSDMVVYNKTNANRLNGISIFYPFYNKNYYDYRWREDYRNLGVFDKYLEYLLRYEKVWLGTSADTVLNTVFQPEQISDQKFTLQLTEEQMEEFASAGFYILERRGDDMYSRVLYSHDVVEENGLLTATFNGKAIYALNDYNEGGVVFAEDKGSDGEKIYCSLNSVLYSSCSIYAGMELETVEILLAVSLDTQEVEIMDVLIREEEKKELETGKRESVDLKDWAKIGLLISGYRYISRDENGIMLAHKNWDKNTAMSIYELPLANGFHFEYLPIEDQENEYYLMFDIMDTRGNRYGSELMPVTVKEQSAEEKNPVETEELVMKDTSSLLLYEDDHARLELNIAKDLQTGQPFMFYQLQNKDSQYIDARITDYTVNGIYQCSGYDGILDVEAGDTSRDIDNFLNTISNDLGVTYPEEVTFELTISNAETGKYYCYRKPIHIRFADGLPIEVQFSPYWGNAVPPQVLKDTSEYRISVLGGGVENNQKDYSASENFVTYFLLENKSEEEILFVAQKSKTNGKEYDPWPATLLVKGGQSYVWKSQTVNKYDFEEEGITQISQLGYTFLIGDGSDLGGSDFVDGKMVYVEPAGEKYYFDLELTDEMVRIPAKDTFFGNDRRNRIRENESLYRDEDLEIHMYMTRELTSDRIQFRLCIQNNTSEDIKVKGYEFLINGKYYTSESEYGRDVPAGGSDVLDLRETAATIVLEGLDVKELEGYLVIHDGKGNQKPITISCPIDHDSTRPIVRDWLTVCGARADEQVLVETEELRISLLSMGRSLSYLGRQENNLYMILQYENLTDHEIKVPGNMYLSINGITTYAYSESGPMGAVLQPGCTMTDMKRVFDSDLKKQQIQEIYDVKLMLLTDPVQSTGWKGLVGGELVQVELAEKSEHVETLKKGTLLDSIDGVDVYLVKKWKEDSYGDEKEYHWQLFVENNSEEHIALNLREDAVNGVSNESVSWKLHISDAETAAHTARLVDLSIYLKGDEKENLKNVGLNFVLRSLGGNRTIAVSDNRMTLKP